MMGHHLYQSFYWLKDITGGSNGQTVFVFAGAQ